MSHVDDGALHAYLDGELTPVERARLETHLAECPACRGRVEEERALIERASHLLGLAQPPERAAPPSLHQLRQPRLLWRLRLPLAWAATVLLALGLGYYSAGWREQAAPAHVATPALADSPTVVAAAPLRAGEPRRNPQAPAREQRRQEPAAAAEADVRADVGKVSDSVGIVAVEAPRELRPVAPQPVPSAAVTTGAAAVDLIAERGRLLATEWPIIRRDPARQLLGADPVGVPGLAVREIRRSPAGDGVVLVEQLLDSATVIQLFQRRMVDANQEFRMQREAAPAAAAPAAQGYVTTERLARFIGRLRVEIAGPLTPDSLNKLLEQLKPIP